MLEWIVESAMEEALARPHPDNLVNLMDETYKDRYGRTTYKGWGSTLNRSSATIAPPSRRVSISLSWVGRVNRFTVVPCPLFARHPCRPFRTAGACADPAMVQ
eukprot:529372-Amphidinium_carterae.1